MGKRELQRAGAAERSGAERIWAAADAGYLQPGSGRDERHATGVLRFTEQEGLSSRESCSERIVWRAHVDSHTSTHELTHASEEQREMHYVIACPR